MKISRIGKKELVIEAVANCKHLAEGKVVHPSTNKEVVARDLAVWLLVVHMEMPLPEVARHFGLTSDAAGESVMKVIHERNNSEKVAALIGRLEGIIDQFIDVIEMEAV